MEVEVDRAEDRPPRRVGRQRPRLAADQVRAEGAVLPGRGSGRCGRGGVVGQVASPSSWSVRAARARPTRWLNSSSVTRPSPTASRSSDAALALGVRGEDRRRPRLRGVAHRQHRTEKASGPAVMALVRRASIGASGRRDLVRCLATGRRAKRERATSRSRNARRPVLCAATVGAQPPGCPSSAGLAWAPAAPCRQSTCAGHAAR